MENTYILTLGKTYYNQGFFNLGIAVNDMVTSEDSEATICLLNMNNKIKGRVARQYNINNTPRVFGYAQLKDCFQANFKMNDKVKITILLPNKFLIEKLGV